MSFAYIPIPLFDEQNLQFCIVTPFPEGGKIVDVSTIDNIAYIIVQTSLGAKQTTAHFHIVPMLQKLYADGYEYVGTFKMENFMGQPLTMFTVIQITSGDFGVHSQEFVDTFGTEERDRIIATAQELLGTKPLTDEDTTDDTELRKLWDFSIQYDGGDDKTNSDESPPSESES